MPAPAMVAGRIETTSETNMSKNMPKKRRSTGEDVQQLVHDLIEESPANWTESLKRTTLKRAREAGWSTGELRQIHSFDFTAVEDNLLSLMGCAIAMDITQPGFGSLLLAFVDLLNDVGNAERVDDNDLKQILKVAESARSYLESNN
jgi:hypothetical protein